MKKLLSVALALCPTLAWGQVNVVPQVGVSTGFVPRTTYSAGFVGLVPAASATDVLCISGSPSKTVQLQQIVLTGTATTAITLPAQLLRRMSADTGGTVASGAANPANNIAKRLTTSPAATATVVAYTANPTINDASPTMVDSEILPLQTSAATIASPAEFYYTPENPALIQPPTLLGTSQQFCINLNGATISGGSLNGFIEWTEQ